MDRKPFASVSEVEEYIGHEVVIDNEIAGVVEGAEIENIYGKKILAIKIKIKNTIERFTPELAFSRIAIDGHNFGKEIE